jgi:predicted amidophosphoribosyltransferase
MAKCTICGKPAARTLADFPLCLKCYNATTSDADICFECGKALEEGEEIYCAEHDPGEPEEIDWEKELAKEPEEES